MTAMNPALSVSAKFAKFEMQTFPVKEKVCWTLLMASLLLEQREDYSRRLQEAP